MRKRQVSEARLGGGGRHGLGGTSEWNDGGVRLVTGEVRLIWLVWQCQWSVRPAWQSRKRREIERVRKSKRVCERRSGVASDVVFEFVCEKT